MFVPIISTSLQNGRLTLEQIQSTTTPLVCFWRSISQLPEDRSLEMVDARMVEHDESVVLPCKIADRSPYAIEGANVVYRPWREWRYFSNMTNDEVLVFRLYDSDSKGSKSWRYPCTAFYDDGAGTVPRESV
jgi:hypothetical protein